MVGLAQLVRVLGCGPRGHEFNSRIPPHDPLEQWGVAKW